jgi:hypothetical protein
MHLISRSPLRLLTAAAMLTGVFVSSAAFAGDIYVCERAGDQTCTCSSPDAAEALPPLPSGCHKERITAAGEQTAGIIRSAEHLGRKAWMREAITKYGERFQQWENAACPKVECVPGSISGYRRCTYSAFACSPEVDQRQLADLRRDRGAGPADASYYQSRIEERRSGRELGPDEIAEMQRLLRRLGYDVSVDGQFGEQTSQALIRFERESGRGPADGEPTPRVLEQLRRAASR